MITAEQIQTVLNLVSIAPSTIGQAFVAQPSVAALLEVGQQLAAGKVLRLYTSAEAVVADKALMPKVKKS